MAQFTTAELGTVVYNSDEGELQAKTHGGWTRCILPSSVLGSGVKSFFAEIQSALAQLRHVRLGLSAVEKHGVGPYNNRRFYEQHARVIGSDGKMYRRIGLRGSGAPDPVTETEPRTIWEEDVQKIHYSGRIVAGGRINADGTLVTAESWNIASATRSGSNSDNYRYVIVLDAVDLEDELGVDDFSDRDYRVQVNPLVDVNDMTITLIVPSDPPCFSVQFEKRVSQSVLHEGVARSFYFVVYAR
ncbi:MAG: hypothetical protein F4X14_01530 [Caldilineaceae bacterium SB0661_bin_32]|uniref:Uncharacterized protein n=1 Tax=Caldilineaceae bacterium SB0661_bin_32 TaxID=2605255 RepID=A0A6B1D206_9CHLR|nr:hypothetical protein [Caldilineaceae bacterium SB0661_bin_32]